MCSERGTSEWNSGKDRERDRTAAAVKELIEDSDVPVGGRVHVFFIFNLFWYKYRNELGYMVLIEKSASTPIIEPVKYFCRTKGGAPCEGPAMKNGRCRMHGGVFYKRETHGKTTLRAKKQRKRERDFLKEMKACTREIEEKVH